MNAEGNFSFTTISTTYNPLKYLKEKQCVNCNESRHDRVHTLNVMIVVIITSLHTHHYITLNVMMTASWRQNQTLFLELFLGTLGNKLLRITIKTFPKFNLKTWECKFSPWIEDTVERSRKTKRMLFIAHIIILIDKYWDPGYFIHRKWLILCHLQLLKNIWQVIKKFFFNLSCMTPITGESLITIEGSHQIICKCNWFWRAEVTEQNSAVITALKTCFHFITVW